MHCSRTKEDLESLRSKLGKMALSLGASNASVLKLSQKLDKQLLLAQKRLHS